MYVRELAQDKTSSMPKSVLHLKMDNIRETDDMYYTTQLEIWSNRKTNFIQIFGHLAKRLFGRDYHKVRITRSICYLTKSDVNCKLKKVKVLFHNCAT